MYYYEIEGANVNRYSVSYDKDEVVKLRELIIENCSEISFKTCEASVWQMKNKEHIRNVNRGYFTRTREDKMLGEICYFMWSYDEYKYPLAVGIIDKFLNGDMGALSRLIKDDALEGEWTLEDKVSELLARANSLDDYESVDEKIKILNEIKKLRKLIKKNKTRKNPKEYLDSLAEIVSLNYESSISIDELLKTLSYLNVSLEDLNLGYLREDIEKYLSSAKSELKLVNNRNNK